MAKHKDLNMATSIVISGVESNTYWDIVVEKCEIKTVLMSFHYLQSKPKNFLAERLAKHPDIKVFIDSGAHTFFQNEEEFLNKDDKFWDDYLAKYTNWARDNKEYIFACANLDIEGLVGIDKVNEWNTKYFEPLVEDGVDVCYIWHTERENKGWEEYCKKHSYIGLTMENDTLTVQQLTKMLNIAKKYNTRVHGMALTKTEILVRVPFFSADSSVDGDSKVLVRYKTKNPTVPYKMEQLSIKELYDKNIDWEFRTFDFETRVPYEDVEVLTVDDNNRTVWGSLYGVVKHIVKKPTVRLKVQGGKDVVCTTDHSIITMSNEGKLVETQADNLKVGDYVLSTKVENAFKDNNSKNALWIKGKQYKMADNALQMYGLWIGDGHISDNYIGFSCLNDIECVKPIKSFMDRKGKNIIRSNSNNVDGRVHSVALVKQFRNLDLIGKSHTKRVPKWVYSLSENQIGQFLKGYFSADGTAPCEISTVSKELKDDLVCLLEMMGIYTSVSYYPPQTFIKDGKEYNAREIWRVSVRDIQSLISFRDKVGFLQQYKMDKLNEYIETKVPRQSRREEKPKYIDGDVDGVTFLKIREIELVSDGTQEVEVYDLSVEKYERFFANGILVHNTTWLVGQQYGELNWFNGRKMQRLHKKEWQRQYKTKLLKPPFNADWDLLMTGMGGRGDTYELLRLNVIAYKLAEEHIRKRLGTKMYWLPKGEDGKVIDHIDIDNIDLPTFEWFTEGNQEGYEKYLDELKIDKDNFTKEEAVDTLYFFYIFLKDDTEALDAIDDLTLIEYAQQTVEGEISTREDAEEALKEYFIENASGERTDFRVEDVEDNFVAKDREKYIEEDAFTIIDLSQEQVNQKTSNMLPSPTIGDMPEVDAYDEELKKHGIVAIRDEKGRFLKGQQKVRKPKNIYSEKYPALNCSTCYKSGECPQYKEGYVCAFDRMFKRFDTRNAEDVLDSMTSMMNFNLERMQRAMMFETMDGGFSTPEVTGLIDQNMRLLEKIQQMQQSSPKTILEQRRVVKSDGSEEVTTSMGVNPTGGILSQIFGGGASEEEEKRPKKSKGEGEAIDADYTVEEEDIDKE